MHIAGYSYFALFAVLLAAKSVVPDGGGGWSNPPIIDYVFFFCIGLCIGFICLGYSYFAWTRSAPEFVDWYVNQAIFGRTWVKGWLSLYPNGYILWSHRIFGPIGGLVGFALMLGAVIAIIRFAFRSA